MSAPSPAPWHVVERNYGTWIDDAENHMIARVYITDLDAPDWEQRLHADAELLASAPEAPLLKAENARLRALNAKLLEACELALGWLSRVYPEDIWPGEGDEDSDGRPARVARERCRAAIAAAEKEE